MGSHTCHMPHPTQLPCTSHPPSVLPAVSKHRLQGRPACARAAGLSPLYFYFASCLWSACDHSAVGSGWPLGSGLWLWALGGEGSRSPPGVGRHSPSSHTRDPPPKLTRIGWVPRTYPELTTAQTQLYFMTDRATEGSHTRRVSELGGFLEPTQKRRKPNYNRKV